jgi:hypothetical protein
LGYLKYIRGYSFDPPLRNSRIKKVDRILLPWRLRN